MIGTDEMKSIYWDLSENGILINHHTPKQFPHNGLKNANQWAMLYLTSKAEQLVYLPWFFNKKSNPHFGGSRNVVTTSGVVFLGEIGRVSTPKVDAVVQERFKKMIRFKRVPGQENGRPVMGNPW